MKRSRAEDLLRESLREAREAGLDGGRALLARHREVAEFVRAEYFRIVGATGPAGGTA